MLEMSLSYNILPTFCYRDAPCWGCLCPTTFCLLFVTGMHHAGDVFVLQLSAYFLLLGCTMLGMSLSYNFLPTFCYRDAPCWGCLCPTTFCLLFVTGMHHAVDVFVLQLSAYFLLQGCTMLGMSLSYNFLPTFCYRDAPCWGSLCPTTFCLLFVTGMHHAGEVFVLQLSAYFLLQGCTMLGMSLSYNFLPTFCYRDAPCWGSLCPTTFCLLFVTGMHHAGDVFVLQLSAYFLLQGCTMLEMSLSYNFLPTFCYRDAPCWGCLCPTTFCLLFVTGMHHAGDVSVLQLSAYFLLQGCTMLGMSLSFTKDANVRDSKPNKRLSSMSLFKCPSKKKNVRLS
ncbi:hypothetical protein BgiBS90_003691 [Biomphalaria glabrata]|nr:hypothetical protein BgiBS90_003691 [Biomphalaria glabrata]